MSSRGTATHGALLHQAALAWSKVSPDGACVLDGDASLTWSALAQRAGRLAARLRTLGVTRDTVVGLFVPRSIDAVVATLAVLRAGGAWLPLDPAYPDARLTYLAADARVRVVLSRDDARARAARCCPDGAAVYAVDTLGDEGPHETPDDDVTPDDAAYVIHTSGSTGEPKGVVVEHRNLQHLAGTLGAFDAAPGDRVVQFAPLGFDASVWELALSFYCGATLVITPEALRAPGAAFVAWLEAQRVTHALFTPSMLALLPGALPASLRVLASGGEALPPKIAARFGPGRRFFNLYGPTEVTVYATMWERAGDAAPSLGPEAPGATAIVVDGDGREVADGEPGELLVGGGGVARGYLHRPEMTAARFVEHRGRRYRTGDLVRRRPDGAFDYLGRVDRQVKVRGFRVEPGEVEAAIESLPGVAQAVVALREYAHGERLLLAWVVARREALDLAALRRSLAERLPPHMMPAKLVALAAVPRTDNDKIDLAALPDPSDLRPALSTPYVAPETATERTLAAIWRDVLGVSPIGLHDDLLDLGGDSLRAARILAHARDVFGVTLSPRAALDARTVAALAAIVDASPRAVATAPSPSAEASRVPLTAPQRALWWIHNLDPSNVAYNVTNEVTLRGVIDVAAVARAFEALAARHELLRASVELRCGAPAMRVHDAVTLAFAVTDLRGAATEASLETLRRAEASAPFDLADAPLWRVRLALVDGGAQLLWTTHHLVIDGWSQTVLLRDLADALDGTLGPPPPPLAGLIETTPPREADLAWWRETLEGAPGVFELPADGPRSVPARRASATRWLRVPKALAEGLHAVARAAGATPFVGLCAAFVALCHLDAGADDVVLATPMAERSSRALADAVGFFANTVALRTKVDGAMTFRALLAAVRETTLGALAHAATPFDAVVAAVRPERVDELQPLVQASFAMQEPWALRSTRDGVTIRARGFDPVEAAFDLQWDFWPDADGFEAQVTWRLDACDAAGIARMTERYLALLTAAVTAPDRPVTALLPPWTMARDATCEATERALRAEGVEAIVRLRTNDRGETERVAWIASNEGLSNDALPPFVTVAPLASMPRRADGSIDEVQLRRVALADDDTVERVARRARAEGLSRAAITTRMRPTPEGDPPAIHLADLLPEAPRGEDAARAAATTADAASLDARPPAHADGGPFELPPGSPQTLVEALRVAARSDRGVVFVTPDGAAHRRTYAALLDDALRMCGALGARGLRAGDVAILHADDLASHYTAFWACLLGGVVPVTVGVAPSYDPSHGAAAKLLAVWGALDRPAVLTDASRVDGVRGLLGAGAHVAAVEALEGNAPAKLHDAAHGDVAFIQLTSGSTGTPRCIQMTHRGVLRHARSTAVFNGRGDGEVDVNWLPPDHVGPLVACHLADVCNAREQVQVATAWVVGDPLRWLDLLEAHRATHTWSPNFGYKLVAERLPPADGRTWDLSRVTTFMTGGEQVTLDVMRRFAERVAPYGARVGALQPAFGMAEACTCVSYQRDFSLPKGFHHVDRASLGGALRFVAPGSPEAVTFVDLGEPVPGVELRIADEANRVVPEGTIGRFQIRGAVLTPGYRGDDAANAAAFVGDGWFDTGDLGFLWRGRLALTGRAKDVIVVRGANHPSHELEDAAQRVAGIEPGLVAAVAVDDPSGGTEGAAVFLVADAAHTPAPLSLLAAVRAEVARRTGLAPMYVIPLAREAFPRTSSGKVQRAALRRDLAAGRFAAQIRALDRAEGGARTVPAWFHRPTWRRAPLDEAYPLAASTCVLVRDRGGVAERTAERLRARGWTALCLSRDEFMSPAWRDALVGAGAVLDLTTLDLNPAVIEGLLARVNALTSLGARARLLVASRCSQHVTADDDALPDAAMVPALLSAVVHECATVTPRHVDLPYDDGDADRLAREVCFADASSEVAWRGDDRYAAALEAVDLTRHDGRPIPLREGMGHLVVGGLGGLGEVLSGALLTRWRGTLLVVGRTDAATARASEVWQRLTRLAQASGATLTYASCDVTDGDALARATQTFEATLGRAIDAVWHLAGRYDERTLADTDAEGLRVALAPQVEGARSIERLLATRPEAMLVAFASVQGRMGGFTLGPYAAASRYVEAWVRRRRALGRTRSWCVAWSQWHDTGMNRASSRADRARAKGFLLVTPTRAMGSLWAALRHDHAALLVGLDDRNALVARHLATAPALARRVVEARVEGDAPPRIEARDRFGARVSVAAQRVASLHEASAPSEPVVDEVERRVAAIWCAALGRDRVGAHENFFDLGGHSLLLAQVQQALASAFAREVPMVELFRRPTVRALAEWLRPSQPARVEADAAIDRGRMQRAALEQQRAARARSRKS